MNDDLRALADVLPAELASPPRPFLWWGHEQLDELSGGVPVGGLTVVTGHPRVASRLLLSLAHGAASEQLVPTALFALQGASAAATAVLASGAGVPVGRTQAGMLAEHEVEWLERARETLCKCPLLIGDDPLLGAQGIVEAALDVRDPRSRPRLLIVDSLQLMAGDPMHEVMDLRRAARGHDLAVVVSTGHLLMPRQQSFVQEAADLVLWACRPRWSDASATFSVYFGQHGSAGVIRFGWDGSNLRELRPPWQTSHDVN
jgi:hypothetical protein